MSDPHRNNAPQYVASRIQQGLAEDPRTAELGIRVDVRPDLVYLRGRVSSDEQRAAIIKVAREIVPDLEICDEITVTPVRESSEEETLS